MKIRNFTHKGLKRLYVEDEVKGVPPDTVGKLRKLLAYLDDMEDPAELRALSAWKVHTLTGDCKGIWSLHVTANRRRARSLRFESGGLSLATKEQAPCP